jgi:hypothetical protein
MSAPVPPVPLENVCSVIHDNVLYVYSPTAFLKLDLEPGAEWEELPTGVSVTDGVCVGSTPTDDGAAGFYVVGGVATDQSYNGLQKFTYATGKWESISPATAVTKHRRWHGAAYLAASDSILIYAGNQDGIAGAASSQTFTIQAHAPFEVTSFQSIAPAGVSPILLPWSDTDAVLIGGDVNNRKVMLFNPATSWKDSGASLADPIPKDATAVKGVLLDGDDGSRSLYTFDMTETPTIVRRVVVVNANGAPVTDSPTVLARDLTVRQSESTLTLDSWPKYNDTLAPTEARSRYGVATDGEGLVVFAGGVKEADNHAICIFDARGNSWVDPSVKFASQRVLSDDREGGVTSTTAINSLTEATTTLSSTGTGVAAAAGSSSSKDELSSNTILGIVLGSILGLMLLLGLILFLIRRKKARRNNLEAGAGPTAGMEKTDGALAHDMIGSPNGHFRGHQHQDSAASYSSMAILMGRMNQQKTGLRRNASHDSRSSTSSIFNREFKATISKPMPQVGQHPALGPGSPTASERAPTTFGASVAPRIPPPRPPRGNATLDRSGSTRRSSGWNRYWSGGSALNMLGFGGPKRTTVESDLTSRYSSNNRVTQDSATVPPLHLEGKPELNRVNSGSPTVAQYPNKIPMREGLRGKIERPMSSTSSSGYSSGIPASVHEAWDPLSAKKPWGADRAPSSAYGSTGKNTALDPSSTSARPLAPGLSTQPQLAMASTSSDMSWLNLGDYGKGPTRA